jgi:DNA-directed RNA polymerase specialized sigma24 family protein
MKKWFVKNFDFLGKIWNCGQLNALTSFQLEIILCRYRGIPHKVIARKLGVGERKCRKLYTEGCIKLRRAINKDEKTH